ncbi:hypothetical protein BT63DRAFT_427013 [Microthyrium microscopicum]|uniref:Uncharacterized protein n=1 Tax=Microthyrium microscopicum TaxID=703497 RepID=A0A6A6U361_9PEZI|nr:hypothetical protein BT63DRAFT_427013 [Microthyrium microscopicum]
MQSQNPFASLFSHYNLSLAVLHPSSSPSDPIKVSLSNLHTTDLSYECISYDRSKTFESLKIFLNDEETEISGPLVQALQALRKPDESLLLWADVLLGRTIQEQNEQANLARATLQNAQQTVAYLGSGNDRTSEAFKIVKTLAQWWHQAAVRCDFPANFAQATAVHMSSIISYFRAQDATKLHFNDKELWSSVLAIFESPYFESVQTISDLVLSQDVLITSRSSSIPWIDFKVAFRALVVAMPQMLGEIPSESLQEAFQRVSGIDIAVRRYREDNGLELLPMIQTAKEAKSADPREYVFAMLPITRPSKRAQETGRKVPKPVVDYSKTPQEVFTEAAKFIIEERQDLILWWAERPPNGRKMEGLPSWVPDWTAPLPLHTIKMNNEAKPSLRTWSDSVQPQKSLKVIENVLHLQAHKLDQVKTVSPMFTQENCRKLLLQEWQRLPNIPNQPLAEKVDKFWRTIVMNTGGETQALRQQKPPHKDMWLSFQSILAEERILELMNCKAEDITIDPALVERIKADPQCQLLGPQTGKSEAFEILLRKNSIGRRFFTTESGRSGMTAFEEVPRAEGEAGEADERMIGAMDGLPTDGLGGMMMASFQQFLRQQDPQAASVLDSLTERKEKARGVKAGDVIVATVGGFHPYVLRHTNSEEAEGESNIGGMEFRFVGDCYLHGVMAAEPFLTRNMLGISSWKTSVTVEDIRIV